MNANGSRQTRVAEGGHGMDWQAIPPGTEGNPGPSQFCFTALRRNTNRGIARLVVQVSRPGRIILHQRPGVRRFVGVHRQAGPGRVVLRVRPRGRARQRVNRKNPVRVRAQVTYRPQPQVGEPRTKGRRVWLVQR